jgi:hypothetical protein
VSGTRPSGTRWRRKEGAMPVGRVSIVMMGHPRWSGTARELGACPSHSDLGPTPAPRVPSLTLEVRRPVEDAGRSPALAESAGRQAGCRLLRLSCGGSAVSRMSGRRKCFGARAVSAKQSGGRAGPRSRSAVGIREPHLVASARDFALRLARRSSASADDERWDDVTLRPKPLTSEGSLGGFLSPLSRAGRGDGVKLEDPPAHGLETVTLTRDHRRDRPSRAGP